jgi:hypothetical protein
MNVLKCTIFWSVTPCILAVASEEIKPSKKALHCEVFPFTVTSAHFQRIKHRKGAFAF